MKTVASSRSEKNLEDSRADYKTMKAKEKTEQRIQFMKSKIETEKESIKDCLDVDMFSIAGTKISRIETLRSEIITLQCNLS